MEKFCLESGIRFVPVPSLSQDNDGYLLEEYTPNNATHANELYGDLLISQILEILADFEQGV